MKRLILLTLLVISWFLAQAQTQNCYVRTLGRPDKASEALGGVIVRVKGEHNAIISRDDGTFTIEMPGKKNGDAYSFQQVQKNGYELKEKEIIGRQYALSNRVTHTIVMVSIADLQVEKQRIEDNAYEMVRKNHSMQVKQLEDQLNANTISVENYKIALKELQDNFEHYQSLIEGLADHYAHVDYDMLDDTEREISICIENGDLDRADSLLKIVFDPTDVLQRNIKALAELDYRIAEARGIIDEANADMAAVLKQQEKDAEYLYNLYTISLSRFEKEKALYYIETRAELDTMNVKWQFNTALSCMGLFKTNEAIKYFSRTLRLYEDLAKSQDEYILRVVETMNYMGNVYWGIDKYESIKYVEAADKLCKEYEKTHPESIDCMLVKFGVIRNKIQVYLGENNYDEIVQMANEMYKIVMYLFGDGNKLENFSMTERRENRLINDMLTSMKLIGQSAMLQQDYDTAENLFSELIDVCDNYEQVGYDLGFDMIDYWKHLGIIYARTRRISQSDAMFDKALETINQRRSKNPELYNYAMAEILMTYGEECQNNGRFEKGEQKFLEAMTTLKGMETYEQEWYYNYLTGVTYDLGLLYFNTQRMEESEEMFREALAAGKKFKEYKQTYDGLGRVYCYLGVLAGAKEQYEEAIEFLTEAVNNFKSSNNDPSVNYLYLNAISYLALEHCIMANYSYSYELYEEILPILKDLSQENAQAWGVSYYVALMNQSYNALFVKEFVKAEQYALEALKVNPDDKTPGTNLAAALLLQGKYSKAEKLYRQYKNEFKDALLDDLNAFEAAGVIPDNRKKDVKKIKMLLNE